MNAFTFNTVKSIVCSIDACKNLATFCKPLNVSRCLIVTDPGLYQLGLHDRCEKSLTASGIAVHIFKDVEADPSERVVAHALAMAKEVRAELVIGLGGGSSMDIAKLIAFLAHPNCNQSLTDIYGVDQARGKRLPLIQIPTTAGTGSEVTPVTIITTGETTKMGAVSPLFLPDIAILDATLTTGLPQAITAATGIDAMVHAIEAYTSKIRKNPMSDMLAKEALRLLNKGLLAAFHDGNNLAARQDTLMGAMLAGQAFANAPVAAVHALAYPLGGHYHIPHGLSNSLVLPHVLRFNLPMAGDLYAELETIFDTAPYSVSGSGRKPGAKLIATLENLTGELELPKTLTKMGIKQSQLPVLAEDAMKQERLLVNNPRPVSYQDALAIYQAAY